MNQFIIYVVETNQVELWDNVHNMSPESIEAILALFSNEAYTLEYIGLL